MTTKATPEERAALTQALLMRMAELYGTKPITDDSSDGDKLRWIADWLDRIDSDVSAASGAEEHHEMQDDLRRIAATLDAEAEAVAPYREALAKAVSQLREFETDYLSPEWLAQFDGLLAQR